MYSSNGRYSNRPFKIEFMVNAGGTFFFIVTDEDERLIASLTEGVDDVLDKMSVDIVKAMKRLVENEQFRVFHKGSCNEYHSLFAT